MLSEVMGGYKNKVNGSRILFLIWESREKAPPKRSLNGAPSELRWRRWPGPPAHEVHHFRYPLSQLVTSGTVPRYRIVAAPGKSPSLRKERDRLGHPSQLTNRRSEDGTNVMSQFDNPV